MKYYFAPLQGYTDSIFREVHAKHFSGVDAYYTPFCRVEKGDVRWHDRKDLQPDRNPLLREQNRLVPQIIANTAEEVDILVNRLMELDYHRIDVNFGCPFPMIAKKQKGAGILASPELVKNVLEALKKYDSCEFSVKMRLGMNEENEWVALIPLLNESNLKQITLHARIGKEQYKGEMHCEAFSDFMKQCKIPMVFNGDIVDLPSYLSMCEKYPSVSGVMIGRGLLQNPFLVEEIVSGSVVPVTEKVKRLKSFMSDLTEGYGNVMSGGELQLVQKLSSFWEYLLSELDHRSRKKILKSRKLSDYQSNVEEALRKYKMDMEEKE